MRVCVTGLRGLPGVMGGVETHCEELLPRLAARLPGVRIVAFGRSGYCRAAVHQNVEVRPLFAVRDKRLEAVLHTGWSVLQARREKASLLHIHGIGPALWTPLAKALGVRVLVTHHGADYRRAKWGVLAQAALRAGEWLAIRYADGLIAVSQADAARLRAAYPRQGGKIRVLPNGVSAAMLAPSASQSRWPSQHAGCVLAVGRLVPEKRFHDLIAAMRSLWQAGDRRPLCIVGDADHQDAYAAALRKQASDRVRFLGRLNRERLAGLYASCSVFVLPSAHEGLPIVCQEAIGAGARVLLSNIAANRELGLPEECYFPLGDIQALKDGLASPPPAPANRKALLARFDWDAIAAETALIYRALAEGRSKLSRSNSLGRWAVSQCE